MKLSKRGKITIASIIMAALVGVLSAIPNYDTYETRTMKVYKKNGEVVYLIDGNNHIYKAKGYAELNNKLLVTVDTKGTSNLRDDTIVSWINK